MSSRTDELEETLWAGGAQKLIDLAKLGDLDAIYVVGMAHYDGDEGVEFNREKCISMLQRAADQGHIEATHHLGCFRYYGYGFPDDFRDLNRAAALLKISAAKGYPPSLTFLGSMYENGEGVEKDSQMALQLYRAAADFGDEHGINCVARLSDA